MRYTESLSQPQGSERLATSTRHNIACTVSTPFLDLTGGLSFRPALMPSKRRRSHVDWLLSHLELRFLQLDLIRQISRRIMLRGTVRITTDIFVDFRNFMSALQVYVPLCNCGCKGTVCTFSADSRTVLTGNSASKRCLLSSVYSCDKSMAVERTNGISYLAYFRNAECKDSAICIYQEPSSVRKLYHEKANHRCKLRSGEMETKKGIVDQDLQIYARRQAMKATLLVPSLSKPCKEGESSTSYVKRDIRLLFEHP